MSVLVMYLSAVMNSNHMGFKGDYLTKCLVADNKLNKRAYLDP